jgi:phage terminase large subunit
MTDVNINIPEVFQELFNPYRYKVYGGRGAAKSHTFAIALLVLGLKKPLRILCCREIQLSINDSVKRILDDKIKQYGLEGFYSSTKTEITGINGTAFIFCGLGSNISSIPSKEGVDICWVEEAESVRDGSLTTLIPTIRKKGSEIWFSFNPKDENSPVYQKFVACKESPPNSFIKLVNYYDNPFFSNTTLQAEMEWDKKTDKDKYLHVWEGQLLKQSEANVFKNWAIDVFEAPEDTIFYYGADWGFSQDPSTLVRCYIDDLNRKLYIDYEAYGVGVEIDETPQLFDSVPGSRDWKITADNARPETISYMNRNGFKIVPSKKGKGSVEDGIAFIKKYKIIVHQRCKHVIDELKLYSYKIDPKTGDILPIIVDKHNNMIDALRYAIEKLWQPCYYI